MITHTFLEFEAYASAVGDADLRMVLPRIDKPRWEISEFHLDEYHLQYGSEWSGNIAEGVTRPDGKIHFVPLHGLHHANGLPLEEHSVFVMDAASEFTISVQEPHDWCSVFLPTGPAEAPQHEPSRPASAHAVPLQDTEIAGLRWLLTQLHDSIQVSPNILTESASRNAIKADLVKACQRITHGEPPVPVATGRPPLRRDEMIRSVRDLIATQPHECLTIQDLVDALDISERSLRNVFLEFYGMPPRKFLLIRRLNHVRNMLRASDPHETTVSAVAAHFGFWHFGRFAGAYHKLFQETPSTTLQGRCQPC